MYSKLQFKIAPFRNLKVHTLQIGFQALTVVHGPSGAGKTSLLIHALPYAFHSKKIQVKPSIGMPSADLSTLLLAQIDRTPIAKSSVSMPATYLEVFQEIRDLFGKLPDAQVAGLSAKDFSLSTGEGRCKECLGRGFITLTMRYLEDAQAVCPTCEGKRFQDHVLHFTYRDLNISEILNLTLAETAAVFANHPRINQRLHPALKLGLGYLKLGQPTSTLSGGEAQRLKLVPYFSRRDFTGLVLLLDEPTTGLHFSDCRLLLELFRQMVSQGGTIIVADNDPQLIAGADDTIEMGPGSGPEGGLIVKSPWPFENLAPNES
jgi:excinuclease ABC subunit A